MSVDVIGGCGFVGLNIVESLLRRGIGVNVLDVIDMPRAAAEAFPAWAVPWSVSRVDIRDEAEVRRALSSAPPSAVVFAATITAGLDREARGMREIVDVNLGGLAGVLDALADVRNVNLVYVGSSAVFGQLPAQDEPIGEDWPHRPESLYGITKSTGEEMVMRWASLHRRNAAIARLGWVFGPWERNTGARDTLSPILQITMAARAGEAVSLARDARLDWLYARDAGEAIARLASTTMSGIATYNIGPMRRWPLSTWCARLQSAYLGFRWSIQGPGVPIDLYRDHDGAPLDSTRFQEKYGPLAWHDVDNAFDDFMKSLVHSAG